MFLLFLFAFASVHAASRVYLASAPIPNYAVIGQANLDIILAKSYTTRAKWASQLLDKCGVVRNTIALLNSPICGRVINTRGGRLVDPYVSAGGFMGVTDPTYIFDFNGETTDVNDIAILDNAVGFVLSQGGNGRFTTDTSLPWADDGFPSSYLSAVFGSVITGETATAFWASFEANYPQLFSGSLAGFTQITAQNGNSQLLFIIPEYYWGNEAQFFIDFSAAVANWNSLQSDPALQAQVVPTATTELNIAFTGNDWTINPNGAAYFEAIKGFNNGVALSPLCIAGLATIRVIALRSAAFFINSNQEPSAHICQLAPFGLSVPPIHSGACARNLNCADCHAVPNNACSFVTIGRGNKKYGACVPSRGAGAWCRLHKVKDCNSALGKLPFPVLSLDVLKNLVSKQNKKCVVNHLQPKNGQSLYTQVTVGWTVNGGGRDPACWDIIQDIFSSDYFGVQVNRLQ